MYNLVVKYDKVLKGYEIIEILSERFAIIRSDIESVDADENIIDYELPVILTPQLAAAKEKSCITLNNSNFSGLTGKGVIMGIIDSGITYDHREFENRVIYIWDIPNDRVYNEEEIRGSIDFTDSIGHGTAVAGIAAGTGGVAPGAEIISVAIGRGSSDDIMRGVKFIADRANERNMPFVINISYGTNFGAHNGQSLFEQYIDSVAEENVASIVIASGNEGDKNHHYRGQGSRTVEFNVGRSLESVRLELYKNYLYNASYEIISPDGSTTGVMSGNDSLYNQILQNTDIVVNIIIPTPYTVDERVVIELTGGGFVDSGIWQLKVNTADESVFDIWLPVSEGVTEDTVFLEPEADTTLTIPSTAFRAITVGAYNSENNTFAAFSGRGYTRENVFVKPDVVAPGVNIRTASNTGGYGYFTGTSMAAPFVSGVAALLMEWGIVMKNDENMYGEKIKALLRKYALRNDNNRYPNREWGYGRLCFRNIYNNLEAIAAMSVNELREDEYVSLIIQKNDSIAEEIEKYSVGKCELVFGNYAIYYVPVMTYELLISNTQIGNGIRSGTPLIMGFDGENMTIPEDLTSVQNLPADYRGGGVLVGIADNGINVNDPAFKYENGESRIYSMWVQDDSENSEGLCFGREYSREEIANGEVNIEGDTLHGTNIAKAVLQVAPDAEFVIVKLKEASNFYKDMIGVDRGAIAFESSDLMLAVDYIAVKAREVRKPLSIPICLGTNQGGHDNQTILEIYLSSVALSNGAALTSAAGNEALRGRHTSFEINNDAGYHDVEINVGEGAENFTLWIWSDITERVDVAIIPPIGSEIGRIEARNNFINTYRLNITDTFVTVEYRIPLYRTSSQETIIGVKGAVPGIWRIRVYGDTSFGRIDCWLPIESLVKNVRFVMPSASTTAVVPSTANYVMTVGAYDPLNNRIISSSGRGPSRIGILKPDFVAPSNGSTAISAAISAGVAALLLQWGIVRGNNLNINTLSIKSYILQGAVPLEENTPVPNNVWGYGAVNLFNSFNEL